MRTSVLLTVHDREPEVILSSLRSLHRAGVGAKDSDSEVVLVNDRSAMDYSWLRAYCDGHFTNFIWRDLDAYEAMRLPDGSNGPSRAFNEALAASSGNRVVAMSSDIIITPDAWAEAVAVNADEAIYSPRVWDIEGKPFREYCGPSRIFPMPWFLLMSRDKLVEVGGWDETYLAGVAFDDNDVVARVGLATGLCFVSTEAFVFHQSHTMAAYNPDPAVRAGWDVNREYTRRKWNGIPFDKAMSPMDVTRVPHASGRMTFKFTASPEVLARAIGMTEGMFAKV